MTDFEAMSRMASENMDIRMSPYFVSAKLIDKGRAGHVTMGVDAQVIHDLAFGENHMVALYVINKEQFNKVKAEAALNHNSSTGK